MKYFYFFLFLCLLIVSCSESKQDILKRLSNQILEKSQSLDVIEREIEGIFIKKNQENKIILSESYQKRIIKLSLDGNRLFWVEGKKISYAHGSKTNKFDLSLGNSPILAINPSWSGQYLSLLIQEKKSCRIRVVDIQKQKLLKRGRQKVVCQQLPAVSDDGQLLLYGNAKGELVQMPLSLDTDIDSQSIRFSAKNFVPKYKKIKNRFILYQIGNKAFLVFFGSAGYYRLYYYDGNGEEVKRHAKVFTSPNLYPSRRDWYQQDMPSLASQTEQRRALGLYTADAFAYSGQSGKWQIHALRFDDGIVVSPGFSSEIYDSFVYLRKKNEFLALQKHQSYFWEPISGFKRRAQLTAKSIFLFSGGLVYNDVLNRLYLRKLPFTSFELSLVDFYHEIDFRKGKWKDTKNSP